MNRIVNSTPYYKLTRMIKYKAEEKGMRLVKVNERGTSKTCHKCGSENTSRPTQGKFNCKTCNLGDCHADPNGVENILQRFLAYTVRNGAFVNRPITEAFMKKGEVNSEQVLGSPLLTNKLS